MSCTERFLGLFYFHALALLNRQVQEKKMSFLQKGMKRSLTKVAVQFVEKAWDALTKA